MKNHLIILLGLILIGLLLLAAGCGISEPQRKPVEPPVKIGFALADLNRDGNKSIKKVVNEQQKKDGQVNVTWMDARNDQVEQRKQVDELIKKRVRAVVLQPVDPGEAPVLVEKLARAGIKLVILENLPKNSPVDGYIASDHAMIGQLQARFVLEALQWEGEAQTGNNSPPTGTIIRAGTQQANQKQEEQQGSTNQGTSTGQLNQERVDYSVVAQLPKQRPLNVMILRGDPRDQMAQAITAANVAALQGNKDINLMGIYDHPHWDSVSIPATLAEIMGQDRIDVILANDSSLAMAAVEYLKMGGYEKTVLTVGAGADEKASKALVNGEHDAEVDVQPEMLGQFALKAAFGLAKADHWQYTTQVNNGDYSVPAHIVPARLITTKNAYLLEQRWKDLKTTFEKEDQQQSNDSSSEQEQQNSPEPQSKQGEEGKTILKITTQDGKSMEVQINGEVKKIESLGAQKDEQEGQKDEGEQKKEEMEQ